jgi:hypothetical protein
VCGIAARAAAGAALYAAKHAGRKSFRWSGLAKSTAIGGVFGAFGGGLKVAGRLGKSIQSSKWFGTTSRRFGNPSIANRIRNGASGSWNQRGNLMRTGWSVHKTSRYVYPVFRTSIGRFHLNWKYGRFN